MADAEFTITGRTQVDTSGMDKLKDSAMGAKQAVEELTNAPDATPKVDASGLDGITEAAGRVKQSTEEMTAAMDGALSGMDAPTQNAMRSLEELLGKLQEMESKLKSGSFEFDFDGEGNVQSLKDVERAIEQVIDAQVMLSDQTSDMDFGGKWGDQVNADVDKVLNAYNAEVEAAEAAAEKLVTAEEKAQKAAEASADKVIAAYKRKQQQMGRSIDQLKADLEEYKRKMEEAAKAGDKIGQAEAIKGIEDTSKAIKAVGTAGRTASGGSEQAARSMSTLARMFSTGRVEGESLAASIRGIGKALKTGLGPIGWGIIMFEGLSAAAGKLWEMFKNKSREAAKQAEEARKKAEEEAKKMKEIQIKIEDESNARVIRQTYDYIHRRAVETTLETKAQTREIKHQLDLKMGKIDQEVMEINAKHDRLSDEIVANGKKNGSSDADIADALRRNQDARELAIERKNKERLEGTIEANTITIEKLDRDLVEFEDSLAGFEKGLIKTDQDVTFISDALKNAYTKERKDDKVTGSMKAFLKELGEIKRGEGKPLGMHEDTYWWIATSELKKRYTDVFDTLSNRLNVPQDTLYKFLKDDTDLFLGAIESYKKDADANKEEISRLEAEFMPFLKNASRNESGQYSDKSINEAGKLKAKEIENLRTTIKNDKEEIERLKKENEKLEQNVDTVDKSIENKGKGVEQREKRIAEERAREIRDRETEAEEKKNIETANLDSLNDMLKQAIEAQKKAKSNNNPQEHAKQTALIETLKSAIRDKEEVKSEVKSEIMSVVNDVMAKSKRNGGKMSKQDAAFVKFAEKLIGYFDDGQFDLSELQEFSTYLPLLAKYQASNKEEVAGIMNTVLKNSEKSADIFGCVSKQYKDLHDYVKNGFRKIEERIKSMPN